MDGLFIEDAQKTRCYNPRSSVIYLLWHPKASGNTTIDILLEGFEGGNGREILRFIPSRNSQNFYKPRGLEAPLAEVVLRAMDSSEGLSKVETTSLYWRLEKRGFHVLSYTFDDEGAKVIENASPELRIRE